MNNSSFKDGVQWAWDSTSLELAMSCPRKYQLSMIDQLQPRDKSVHLIFGGYYASALEAFYKYRADGATIDEALLRIVKEMLIETWDEKNNCPKNFMHNAKSRFGLIRTIVWYLDQFAQETEDGLRTYHLPSGKPAVELSFTIEFDSEIVFCGHLDRVVQYVNDLYVMDQKTTGSTIGPYFFRQFDMSSQMTAYAYAGQVVLGSPVRGVIIDGAQIAVGFTRFERGFTYRTKDQLEEWRNDAEHHIHLLRSYSQSGYFPRNLTSCDKYGGCPFLPICSAPKHVRPKVIESDYVSKVWNPLERR